ncbi:glycosyltransferase family 2 protein [Marinomonas posidonica]|uniref:Glycosyl transferase family 2 n=1 Tax=Marinomonas posidonica (strain CECT 7376 / NCIMB 14433 / IVIA-Po-181) TaxID=491952 RepID=F6CZQ2_MARPP|nr:glycosyltransferase family 2 protein [Marinomonas posidonica]AEF53563.1 glycosyl transferase family 2 [Marinomonas posidonica IVIA-Po-181]
MIQILLATYNGAKYLEAQLDSLLAQTCRRWTLIAHDDGSNDQTLDILRAYQLNHPDIIEILEDGLTFGNPCDNFTHLLASSVAEYVMFCDQDDVWLPDKIEKSFNKMQALESKYPSSPVVVHTDLEVVDESLFTIAPSMFEYQGLDKSIKSLLQILAKGSVTGCTMMMNRQAIAVSQPILPFAVMHDWWIAAMVIKHQGVVEFIDEPLIQYRQHTSNSIGAKKNSFCHLLKRSFNYLLSPEAFFKAWNQAKVVQPNLNFCYFLGKKIHIILKNLF